MSRRPLAGAPERPGARCWRAAPTSGRRGLLTGGAAVLLAGLLLLVAAVAEASSVPGPGPGPERHRAIEDALEWLGRRPPSEAGLEAAAAAGRDTSRWPASGPWYGAVAVPGNGDDALLPLREILAVASAGGDPASYPDPVRGTIDLVAQLRANVPAAVAATSDAAPSFQILAMAASGVPADDADVQALAARLRDDQGGGGWGCGGGSPNPDCTGFAMAALKAAGSPPPPGPVLAFLEGMRNPDGGFPLVPGGQSSTQSTAWAIAAYRGLALEPPQSAWQYLLGQQREDGSFECWADGSDCARLLATSEAVVALAGSHPFGPGTLGTTDRGSPGIGLAFSLALMVAVVTWQRRA